MGMNTSGYLKVKRLFEHFHTVVNLKDYSEKAPAGNLSDIVIAKFKMPVDGYIDKLQGSFVSIATGTGVSITAGISIGGSLYSTPSMSVAGTVYETTISLARLRVLKNAEVALKLTTGAVSISGLNVHVYGLTPILSDQRE